MNKSRARRLADRAKQTKLRTQEIKHKWSRSDK